ncbi:kinase-like domain-containing protein [Gigaspora rosea]|uniref:Kinase-like domain-containing protein n=1 Tax=Gigaspora rosea TaxID=44941 RepID=A0A397UZ27_9GLOM|nr:kinase-like domain-containing protein [Gigaspora rosea]
MELNPGSQSPLCPQCNQPKTLYHWCPKRKNHRVTERELTQEAWTSGNEIVDEFIREVQENAPNKYESLKWIPYDQLSSVKVLAQGGHGTIHTAVWTNEFGTTNVVLKRLDNSKEISAEFFHELAAYMKCSSITSVRNYVIKAYGITKDPTTDEFIMVTQHAELGDLKNFCNTYSDAQDNTWWSETIIDIMFGIIKGLTTIHKSGLVHGDLHSGNILIHGQAFSSKKYSCIGDLGLCQPAERTSSGALEGIHGVIPYMSPEVLCGKPYTKASDIYSFGMIMWELSSKSQPFCDRAHDEKLVIDILRGERPEILAHMPEPYVKLMTRCWDSDPSKRPTAIEIGDIIDFWKKWCLTTTLKVNEDMLEKFKDEKKKMTHPKAIYTSRYLRYQKIGEYLDLWELQEDTRENKDLLGPQPWVKKDLKGFGMIALPPVAESQNA